MKFGKKIVWFRCFTVFRLLDVRWVPRGGLCMHDLHNNYFLIRLQALPLLLCITKAHIHTHTHTPTHKHTNTHTHIHSDTRTHTQTHTYGLFPTPSLSSFKVNVWLAREGRLLVERRHTNLWLRAPLLLECKRVAYRAYPIFWQALVDISCVSGILAFLTWLWWFGFRLETISGNDQAAQNIVTPIKSGYIVATFN